VPFSVRKGSWYVPTLQSIVLLLPAGSDRKPLCVHPAALGRMRSFVQSMGTDAPQPMEIEIIGPAGSGKRTLAAQFASDHAVLVCDCAMLADKPPEAAADNVVRVLRLARAHGAIPYWRSADAISAAAWRAGHGLYDLAIFDREAPSDGAPRDGVVRHAVSLLPLSSAERLTLWRELNDDRPPAPVRDPLLL